MTNNDYMPAFVYLPGGLGVPKPLVGPWCALGRARAAGGLCGSANRRAQGSDL